jgi:hypothetical protein
MSEASASMLRRLKIAARIVETAGRVRLAARRDLARKGAAVVVHYLKDAEKARAVVAGIGKEGGKAIALQAASAKLPTFDVYLPMRQNAWEASIFSSTAPALTCTSQWSTSRRRTSRRSSTLTRAARLRASRSSAENPRRRQDHQYLVRGHLGQNSCHLDLLR